LFVGFAAFIPWFLLCWTAASPGAGMLQAYYPFPFMVAMGWPLVAVLCKYGRNAPHSAFREALALQAVLVLLGLVMWDKENRLPSFSPAYWARWSGYAPKWIPSVAGRRTDIRPATRDLAIEIGQNPALGAVIADVGVLAFAFETAPQMVSVDQYNLSKLGLADTVAYFCPNGDPPSAPVAKAATKAGLTRNFRAPPTAMCLLTNRSQEELGQLGRSLQPKR
jgi:hypothetical protein